MMRDWSAAIEPSASTWIVPETFGVLPTASLAPRPTSTSCARNRASLPPTISSTRVASELALGLLLTGTPAPAAVEVGIAADTANGATATTMARTVAATIAWTACRRTIETGIVLLQGVTGRLRK